MEQSVEAGLIKELAGFVKSALGALSKFVEKFDDLGIETVKEEKYGDGGVKMFCKYNRKDFGMIWSPAKGEAGKNKEGYVDLMIHIPNVGDAELKEVSEFDVKD